MANDDDDDEESQSKDQWDSHGLRPNIVVPLKKFSQSKRYKVSSIDLYDEVERCTVIGEDKGLLMDLISLEPLGLYRKEELQEKLEKLSNHGSLEKLDLQGITQPDGTIGIKISFKETELESPRSFRCMDAGLMWLMSEKERKDQLAAVYKSDEYLRMEINRLRESIEELAARPLDIYDQ